MSVKAVRGTRRSRSRDCLMPQFNDRLTDDESMAWQGRQCGGSGQSQSKSTQLLPSTPVAERVRVPAYGKHAASQALGRDIAEEALHHVHPRRRGRREVRVEPRVLGQPVSCTTGCLWKAKLSAIRYSVLSLGVSRSILRRTFSRWAWVWRCWHFLADRDTQAPIRGDESCSRLVGTLVLERELAIADRAVPWSMRH